MHVYQIWAAVHVVGKASELWSCMLQCLSLECLSQDTQSFGHSMRPAWPARTTIVHRPVMLQHAVTACDMLSMCNGCTCIAICKTLCH